jgi:hypothetical protein
MGDDIKMNIRDTDYEDQDSVRCKVWD